MSAACAAAVAAVVAAVEGWPIARLVDSPLHPPETQSTPVVKAARGEISRCLTRRGLIKILYNANRSFDKLLGI